jgi:hypothetical protein
MPLSHVWEQRKGWAPHPAHTATAVAQSYRGTRGDVTAPAHAHWRPSKVTRTFTPFAPATSAVGATLAIPLAHVISADPAIP